MKHLPLILTIAGLCSAQAPRLFTYYSTPGVSWGTARLKAPGAVGDTSITLTGLPDGKIPDSAQFTLSASVYTVVADAPIVAGDVTLKILPGLRASATAGTAISPWVWKAVVVDPPLALSVDGAGLAHLGIGLTGIFPNCSVDSNLNLICGGDVAAGLGIITTSSPGVPTTVSVDTSYAAFRTIPPAGPGPCTYPWSGGSAPIGTGSWAAGRDPVTKEPWFYLCVPGADIPGQFVWARTQMQLTW